MSIVAKEVATKLHSLQCRYNHTDGCGWYYDEHNWTEFAHAMYLTKAYRIIQNVGDGITVDKVLEEILK